MSRACITGDMAVETRIVQALGQLEAEIGGADLEGFAVGVLIAKAADDQRMAAAAATRAAQRGDGRAAAEHALAFERAVLAMVAAGIRMLEGCERQRQARSRRMQ